MLKTIHSTYFTVINSKIYFTSKVLPVWTTKEEMNQTHPSIRYSVKDPADYFLPPEIESKVVLSLGN